MSRKKSVRYREGSCFAVPLRTGGFARGIVARMDGDGRLFAYFFGPKLERLEQMRWHDLTADRAILSGMCGDLGIIKGEWPVLDPIPTWDRSHWPMPQLYRVEESTGKAWLSRYDEDTLNFVEQIPVIGDLEGDFPYDRLMGYGSVEIRLTRLLDEDSNQS